MYGILMLAVGAATGLFGPATGLAVYRAAGPIRLEHLFQSWEQAKDKTQSLTVEFTLHSLDKTFGDKEEFTGTFKLLKTSQGKVIARYEVKKLKTQETVFLGLLINDAAYYLETQRKVYLKVSPGKDGVLELLRTKWNPLVSLIDKAQAQKNYQLKAAMDTWYTYINVTPVQRNSAYDFARVVLTNKDSPEIPRNMPKEIWYQLPNYNEVKWDIHKWEFNSKNGPKLEDFETPEKLPGWRMAKWPPKVESEKENKGKP